MPDAKTFEIWTEGYRATGEQATARKLGTAEGDDFRAACGAHFGADVNYDADQQTYWGCRLFDNEEAARQRFG